MSDTDGTPPEAPASPGPRPLDPSAILFDGEHLLAVAKPVGVPVQAAREGSGEDLVSQLQGLLGTARPLGVHQRLDAETSGVIVFSRSKAGAKALAQQFEGRRLRKRYLAAVEGEQALRLWKKPRTLKHRLATENGRSVVVDGAPSKGRRASPKNAKLAVSHVRIAERRGEKLLLEVEIETGRRHQIRAQLAAMGSPVVGDRLYGGSGGPRLLLHARSLEFSEPIDGERRLSADVPPEFAAWFANESPYEAEALRRSLNAAMRRRHSLLTDPETTTFRLLEGDAEGIEGATIDAYGQHLVLNLYDAAVPHEAALLDAIAELPFAGVYVKRRPRQANVLTASDGATLEAAPAEPLRGTPAPDPLWVLEGAMRYPVSLGQGIPTGLYLDARDAHQRIRAIAGGRELLNLFAYTGAFSVAAALGGAKATDTVDVARPALERAKWAFEGNGFQVGEQHRLTRADCFGWLERAAKRDRRYDLIVCDPPTYATTKKTRWKSGKGWERLAEHCFRVGAGPGSILLLCSNDRRMSLGKFRQYVHRGAEAAGVRLGQLKELPAPIDVPAYGEHPLKRLWCRID